MFQFNAMSPKYIRKYTNTQTDGWSNTGNAIFLKKEMEVGKETVPSKPKPGVAPTVLSSVFSREIT